MNSRYADYCVSSRNKFYFRRFLLVIAASLMSTIAFAQVQASEQGIYSSAINHSDRPTQDRTKDKTRKPKLILPFTQLKAGDLVLELGSGGGHTTELLSRVAGKNGKVYAQGLSANRTTGNRLPNVVALRKHLLYELDDVLAENKVSDGSLDSVVIFFALHDFYLNSRIDKEALYSTIFRRLKPGGSLIVLDNAADDEAGTSDNRRLHRIGKNFVIAEIEQSGFVVESESDALHNPDDNHTRPWQNFAGMHDRFAIRFIKK